MNSKKIKALSFKVAMPEMPNVIGEGGTLASGEMGHRCGCIKKASETPH